MCSPIVPSIAVAMVPPGGLPCLARAPGARQQGRHGVMARRMGPYGGDLQTKMTRQTAGRPTSVPPDRPALPAFQFERLVHDCRAGRPCNLTGYPLERLSRGNPFLLSMTSYP